MVVERESEDAGVLPGVRLAREASWYFPWWHYGISCLNLPMLIITLPICYNIVLNSLKSWNTDTLIKRQRTLVDQQLCIYENLYQQ